MGWRISFGVGPLRYSAPLRRSRRRRSVPYRRRGFIVTAAELDAIRTALYREGGTMDWFNSIPDKQKRLWMKANGIHPPVPPPSSVYDPRQRRRV